MTDEATRAKRRAYYQANRERILARCKAYREEHRDQCSANSRAWYAANRDRAIAYRRQVYADNTEVIKAKQRVYNRTRAGVVGAHDEIREGPCEICATECKLVLDHDHATGIFRGWLCNACNKALGGFKDSPALLRNAANYVEKSKT